MTIKELIEKWKGKEPPRVVSLGSYPVAYPGLTLYHGLSGSLKSFSSVIIARELEYDIKLYLDFEGNSVDLKTHCMKNGVEYLNLSYGSQDELLNFMTDVAQITKNNKVLVIVDSFSRVFTEPLNETHKIDKIFKFLKYQCTEYNYSLLIIDHSKKLEFGGIEIRGGDNKKKFADVVIGVKDKDLKKFTSTIEIEKSRLSNFTVGDSFIVKSSDKKLKDEFLELIKTKNIKTKTDCNRKLSKRQREIYREYIENINEIIKDIA